MISESRAILAVTRNNVCPGASVAARLRNFMRLKGNGLLRQKPMPAAAMARFGFISERGVAAIIDLAV